MSGYAHRHLLGTRGLTAAEITDLLDRANRYAEINRTPDKKHAILSGRTVVNLFYENSSYNFV